MSKSQFSITFNWQLCALFCLVALLMVSPDAMAASASNGISDTLCKIVTQLTGPIGKAVGMIALVVLGMGIFLGKLSWPLALATALGITFIFSASTIMAWLGGSGSSC